MSLREWVGVITLGVIVLSFVGLMLVVVVEEIQNAMRGDWGGIVFPLYVLLVAVAMWGVTSLWT